MCDVNLSSLQLELVSLLPKDLNSELKDAEPDIMSLLNQSSTLVHCDTSSTIVHYMLQKDICSQNLKVLLDTHYRLKRSEEALRILQIVIDITWEQLNTGHWSQVPDSERMVYSVASLMKVVAVIQNSKVRPKCEVKCCLEAALKAADLGLLLGCSLRHELTHSANLLSSALYSGESKRFIKESSVNDPLLNPTVKVITEPIRTLNCPSLETFSAEHFYPRLPVKLTGCISHWPALKRWKDVDYLLRVAGARTVPIEFGSKYTESDWSQKLMTVKDFILKYILTDEKTETAYLAQHQLFNQVPELREDIIEPDYCCCSDNQEDLSEEVDINAWFGPAGTVSPLHFDPKHNLLAQVVGRKCIVLYSPKASEYLYPHEGRLLNNTAQVDPENPDYKKFPKYRDTTAMQCILNPGDMLYIPPTWWHQVRSLDVSFSVSFWWT